MLRSSPRFFFGTCLGLALAVPASAQTGFGFNVAPIPFYIIKNDPAAAPGSTIESIHHVKLSNNPDGVWTTSLTCDDLEVAYGGDGSSKGVFIGLHDPYNLSFSRTTEANALNSRDDDIHLAMSPDGLWAIFERKSLSGRGNSVQISNRPSVGTAFPPSVSVAGFPTSGLFSGELHPYLGPVNGRMMCFYTTGTQLVMQPIDLANATLTGSATAVANPAQVGTQPGAPSPMIGADGDVEALFACDIVIPQTGPGTGDSDPTFHNDLLVSTPGGVRVQRSDWQGWGSVNGGFINFSHDILGFHAMHVEGAILLGDAEPPGGVIDLRTQCTNYDSPNPLIGGILISAGPGPAISIPNMFGKFALSVPFAPVALITATNDLDGVGDVSVQLPGGSHLSGQSLAIQALMLDASGVNTWSNTAWIHIL